MTVWFLVISILNAPEVIPFPYPTQEACMAAASEARVFARYYPAGESIPNVLRNSGYSCVPAPLP